MILRRAFRSRHPHRKLKTRACINLKHAFVLLKSFAVLRRLLESAAMDTNLLSFDDDECEYWCSLPEAFAGENIAGPSDQDIFGTDTFEPTPSLEEKPFNSRTDEEIYAIAIRIDWPQLNFLFPLTRQKKKTKRTEESDRSLILHYLLSSEYVLADMADRIDSFFDMHSHYEKYRCYKRDAKTVFDRCVSQQACMTIRDFREGRGKELWESQSGDKRKRWQFLAYLHNCMYIKEADAHAVRTRIPVPPGVEFPDKDPKLLRTKLFSRVPCILCTHQTDAYRDDPAVAEAEKQNLGLMELAEEMKTFNEYESDVKKHVAWALQKGKELGAATVAVGIELCHRPDHYGRVHRHTLFGIDILPNAHPWARADHVLLTCGVDALVYEDKFPHVSSIYSKNGKGHEGLVRNGAYYVIGPKKGQIFSACYVHQMPVQPFLDRISISLFTVASGSQNHAYTFSCFMSFAS